MRQLHIHPSDRCRATIRTSVRLQVARAVAQMYRLDKFRRYITRELNVFENLQHMSEELEGFARIGETNLLGVRGIDC